MMKLLFAHRAFTVHRRGVLNTFSNCFLVVRFLTLLVRGELERSEAATVAVPPRLVGTESWLAMPEIKLYRLCYSKPVFILYSTCFY